VSATINKKIASRFNDEAGDSLDSACDVLVAASAYGADLVHRHGHAYLLPIVAAAGAKGIEIRRELMEGIPAHADLLLLHRQIVAHDLYAVYSTPVELWRADGTFAQVEMTQAMQQAAALQARFLKVSLGFFTEDCEDRALAILAAFVADAPVPVILENDQTPQGGRLPAIERFLKRCETSGIAVGMTFDIGNWRWQQGDAAQAALALGRFVRYVHCKGVREVGGKLNAVPLSGEDPHWRMLFRYFSANVPRAIEFPLVGDDLAAVTRRYVDLLKNC
jgi:sugar phosphate isomerase/epimerase